MAIVTDPNEIAKLVKRFRDSLSQALTQRISVNMGHKGYSGESQVWYSPSLKMWMEYDVNRDTNLKRYWAAFGLGELVPRQKVSITTEVNFPLKGINWRIAGAFDENAEGKISVVHTGKIGGSREGRGKSFFWEHYTGEKRYIILNQVRQRHTTKRPVSTRFALVGELDSPNLVSQVRDFVAQVRDM